MNLKTPFYNRLQDFLDGDGSVPGTKKLASVFMWILAAWMTLWTILPGLCIANVSIDVAENVAWGQHFQFGYDKNPYFGAWLTYFFFRLIPSEYVSYFLSQASVAAALTAMWCLATDIFHDRFKAFLTVVFMLTIPFFSQSACEFNDDVIEIGLWGMLALFFSRAVKTQKLHYWALAGLTAGLAFMTKYLACALFIPLGLMLFITPEGRSCWKRPGLYIAALIFTLLSLPNIIWLFQNDFIAFRYAAGRAEIDGVRPAASHLLSPLKLCLEYLLRIIFPAVAMFLLFRRADDGRCTAKFDKRLIRGIACGPFLLSLAFAAVTGGDVISSWLTPYYVFSGLFFVMLFNPAGNTRRLKIYSLLSMLFIIGIVFAFGYEFLYRRPYKKSGCVYNAYPGRETALALTEQWRERFKCPVPYVIGGRKESCNMTFYSPDMPAAFFDADTKMSPWIDPADIEKEGAVLIWQGRGMPPFLKKYKKDLQILPCVDYERRTMPWFRMLAGAPPTVTVRAAFLPPESERKNKTAGKR